MLSVPAEWSNRIVRCSFCSQSLQVPMLGAAPGPPPAGPVTPPAIAPNAAAPPPYMNPMPGAPPAPGGPAAGPGPIVDTGDSHSGGSSVMQERSRRRSSKGLIAWYSGGGGVVVLVIIILLKLFVYGAANAAYDQACEDVRWEAYNRYAVYGSPDYVQATVDTFHEDCIYEATDGPYSRTPKLDRRYYFELMDFIFEKRRQQSRSGF